MRTLWYGKSSGFLSVLAQGQSIALPLLDPRSAFYSVMELFQPSQREADGWSWIASVRSQ
jgi:hypothetical protein